MVLKTTSPLTTMPPEESSLPLASARSRTCIVRIGLSSGQPRLLSGQRHLDVEVAFLGDDLEGHDEEDQQLKHDVDHRRHLQFDLLVCCVPM